MSIRYSVVFRKASEHRRELKGWHALIQTDDGFNPKEISKDSPCGYGLTKKAALESLQTQAWLFLKGHSQHLYRCLAASRSAKA
jgi:hypothetical protein